mgnify:FL=1
MRKQRQVQGGGKVECVGTTESGSSSGASDGAGKLLGTLSKWIVSRKKSAPERLPGRAATAFLLANRDPPFPLQVLSQLAIALVLDAILTHSSLQSQINSADTLGARCASLLSTRFTVDDKSLTNFSEADSATRSCGQLSHTLGRLGLSGSSLLSALCSS